VAVNGHDTSTWDLAKVKRVLVGRNGSTCVLTVRQKGAHSVIDVTLMRGCLEWWELHDRVSLTEQQLAESEKSAQEFRQMWMVESKRAASESTQREELSIELEGYRAALASTRNALRVADDELAKEYAKTSELKIELSRLKASLEGQLKEQQEFMERSKEAMASCNKAQVERDEAEKEIRKLRQEIEDLKRQASGAEEERDLSHRMYREVDFARKTAMQRLADAQAQLALLTSDNEAMKKDLQSLQQDKDRDNGLKHLAEQDMDAARRSADDAQRELKEQKALKDRLEEEKQALSNEVVRLQTMLADKEQQVQSADMRADAHLQRIPPLEKAAAKVAVLQQELETTLSKLCDTEKELAVLEAKLAHSMASEAALELRIKHTDKQMGEELSDFQGLKREHEDLTLKYRELETSYKACQAAKDLLVEYRGTIENLQDGLKSQNSEVIRLKEVQAALVQEKDNCKREIEEQRKHFDENMRQKQSEITEKMLASHLNLENAQKSFDAKLMELTEKGEQEKAQYERFRLEFGDMLRAKDLEIQQDLAELDALKHDFDKRVEKERINLVKQFKEQTDDLHEQLKQLLKLKESADKEHEAEVASCKAELSDRIHQFTRDQDDLNQQWSVRYEALVKTEEAERARMAAANARKVESLQSDLKQEQDDRNRIIASIPEKVQKECEIIVRQKQFELDSLNKSVDARIASERMSVATDWQLKMDELRREHDAAIGKVKNEWQDKYLVLENEVIVQVNEERRKCGEEVSKISAQLQDQLRRQAELEELAKSVESRIASERMSVALEWQLKMDELKREHDEAIGKVKSDCQEKYMILKNEVMALKNECQGKINEERRKYDENMANISKELKDQLSQEKVRWIEQHGAMERDLREKCAFYQQERDHVKAELDRFYKLPNPVGVGLALKYAAKNVHDLEDIVIDKVNTGN
jgi:hypothetical protein